VAVGIALQDLDALRLVLVRVQALEKPDAAIHRIHIRQIGENVALCVLPLHLLEEAVARDLRLRSGPIQIEREHKDPDHAEGKERRKEPDRSHPARLKRDQLAPAIERQQGPER
jgi:hypothetical protein